MDALLSATVTSLVLAMLVAVTSVPIELKTENIPNWLTLGGLLFGLALAIVDGRRTMHVSGFVLGAVPAVILWRRRVIGGGGVKLVAAVGALGGGIVAVGIWTVVGAVAVWTLLLKRNQVELPSSPWICTGTVLAGVVAMLTGRLATVL